jgi:hypothetical protein
VSTEAESAILSELRQLRAEQAAFRALLAPLMTRKTSRAKQANQAGCSKSTLWRREKAAQRKLKLAGIL